LFVAAHRHRRAFEVRAAAGAQCGGGLLLFLGRHLAGGGERGDLGGGGLACAFGDLAARFLLAAACLLVVGVLFRLFFAPLAGLVLLGLARDLFLGAQPFFLGGLRRGRPPRILLFDGGARALLVVGLARILQRAHAAGTLLCGQRARQRHRAARRLGRLRRRR